jgi:hypothetical protein
MQKTLPVLVAAGLTALARLALPGAAVVAVGVVPDTASAQPAKGKASGPKMNPKVLKPLQAALEASNAGNFAEAEAQLKVADAVPDKTPFEQFQIDELGGFVAVKQKKYNEAAQAFDRGLASGLLPPEQVNDRLKLLSQLYLQTEPRDLAKSGDFGKRWLQATGTRDPAMLGLVGQSAYFGENPGEAVTYMKEAVDTTKAAGGKPEENWLLILQSSYSKLKNAPGITEATTDLVRYYPRPEHWQTLKRALLADAAGKERQILQVYRLMYQVEGGMSEPDDFTEAASAAKLLGSPGEAVKFMEKGYSSGVLETSGDKARSKALLDEYRGLAASDQKSLPQFEKEAEAAKAGEADVRLGEAWLSYDQPAKGLAAIQRGIGKGGLKSLDEANLALGRAYILTNNAAEARKAFEAVKGPEFARLAQLWAIRAGQQ